MNVKKTSIFFIVILISFLSACSNNITDDEKKNLYIEYFMELEEKDLYQRGTIEVFHDDTYYLYEFFNTAANILYINEETNIFKSRYEYSNGKYSVISYNKETNMVLEEDNSIEITEDQFYQNYVSYDKVRLQINWEQVDRYSEDSMPDKDHNGYSYLYFKSTYALDFTYQGENITISNLIVSIERLYDFNKIPQSLSITITGDVDGTEIIIKSLRN